jgi:hypothetical protein
VLSTATLATSWKKSTKEYSPFQFSPLQAVVFVRNHLQAQGIQVVIHVGTCFTFSHQPSALHIIVVAGAAAVVSSQKQALRLFLRA